jgi:hypothetical protein
MIVPNVTEIIEFKTIFPKEIHDKLGIEIRTLKFNGCWGILPLWEYSRLYSQIISMMLFSIQSHQTTA